MSTQQDLLRPNRRERHPSESWKGKIKGQIKPGSAEHAYQAAAILDLKWERKSLIIKEFDTLIAEIDAHQLYKKWPIEQPVGSLDAFIEKVTGTDVAGVRATLAGKARKQAKNVKQGKHLLDNIKKIDDGGGTSQEYLLRRLARTHPDILDAYERGDYPSVRQAAIAAGIVKVPTSLDQLQKLWAKATEEERANFLAWLSDHREVNQGDTGGNRQVASEEC